MDEETLFSEDDRRWLQECIMRWTIGIKPTLEEWNSFSPERQEFYFEYAKIQKKIDIMDLAIAFGNVDYAASIHDSSFRLPGDVGAQTILEQNRAKRRRKLEKEIRNRNV